MTPASPDPPGPWLTLAEANARLRFKSRFGIYAWLKTAQAQHVHKVRRGKVWLLAKKDVDAALEPALQVRRQTRTA